MIPGKNDPNDDREERLLPAISRMESLHLSIAMDKW
jgi:hypothetical protein